MSNVLDFLQQHNVKFVKAAGDEVIVSPCPWCGTPKNKCYVNKSTGLFDCKICKEKGNFAKFKRKFGVIDNVNTPEKMWQSDAKPLDMATVEKYQQDLDRAPEALDYLYSRGFTHETIKKFKLGYVNENGMRWIAIPHISEGQVWNIKFRNIDAKQKEDRFKRVQGQPTILFNVDNIDFEKGAITLVESETDCMSAVQLGMKNTVALTAGADTFKAEWLSIFAQFSKVFLMLNTDDAGKAGTDKIAQKIGLKKIRIVELEQNDVNDFLKEGGTNQELRALIASAKRMDMQDIADAKKLADDAEEWLTTGQTGLNGVPFGYETLDALTRGAKPADLIIITGDSGIGKTTFMNNIVNNMIRHEVPVMCFFLEGQITYYIVRMMSAEYGVPYTELHASPEVWGEVKGGFEKLPLFSFSGDPSDIDHNNILDTIRGVIELYDIQFILIDNMQLVIPKEDVSTEREFITKLKHLATGTQTPIALITHIKKPGRGEVGQKLSMHDIKGSGATYQSADLVLLLQPSESCYYLTIDKQRMGPSKIDIKFEFDASTGAFRELDPSHSSIPTETE